ncbi:MAG TPA: hypothetical protein VM618_02255, partial [Acidimicrobiia bacterium]|nr:hypothetical protein [Acidimicrobiia bacterium]
MTSPFLTIAQTAEETSEACGPADEASYLCRWVFESTESEFWAKTADFVVAKPLQIALILFLAWLGVRLIRRAINRFVDHAKDDVFQHRVNELRKRTGVAMVDTGPIVSARRAQRAEAIGNVLRSFTAMVIYVIAAVM